MYEQMRRVLSASHIQAEVERFLIEVTNELMHHCKVHFNHDQGGLFYRWSRHAGGVRF